MEKGRIAGRMLHNPPRSGLPIVEILPTELIRGRTAGLPGLSATRRLARSPLGCSPSPMSSRTARSSRLLTSVAEARRVSQASRLTATSEITRGDVVLVLGGFAVGHRAANIESMIFSTWSTSPAATASAKTPPGSSPR